MHKAEDARPLSTQCPEKKNLSASRLRTNLILVLEGQSCLPAQSNLEELQMPKTDHTAFGQVLWYV